MKSYEEKHSQLGRREIAQAIFASPVLLNPSFASAKDEGFGMDDVVLPAGQQEKTWLWQSMREGKLDKLTYGRLEGPDIFYPSWMYGLWNVSSTTRTVQAPLGEQLFGRPGALEEANKEIGQTLQYKARFKKAGGDAVVADRPYNVDSISRASMGDSAVLQCMEPDDNANRLQMTLVPAGAGGRVFVADLKVYARDFSKERAGAVFGCSESSHQIISAENDPMRGNVGIERFAIPRGPTVSEKDIDVVQLFCRDNGDDEVQSFRSVQRICTFMTEADFRARVRAKKIQGNNIAQLYESIKKVPIDVRVYDLTYTLLRRPKKTA